MEGAGTRSQGFGERQRGAVVVVVVWWWWSGLGRWWVDRDLRGRVRDSWGYGGGGGGVVVLEWFG